MNLRSCRLDLTRGLVWRDGGTLTLTPAEGRLLSYLVANAGRVVPNTELLEQVWGYRRGVRSRTVATTVRRLREKIEAAPADPDHLLTAYGTGYRFEPLAAGEPAPLLGRAGDLARLAAAPAAIVTLVGPAGAGKTRLARAWLADQPGLFVDLRAATTIADLAPCLALAMRIAPSPRITVEQLGEALDARNVPRVVLDNVEQIGPGAGEVVLALARAAPRARWVVTSRQPLEVDGEHVFPLAPLAEDDAVALLVEVARRTRPGARLDDTEVLRAIARRLDGLPLAIEVVGARLGVMSPRELDGRLTALGSAGIDPGGRLSEAIAWSWRLLEVEERDVLARVSVFRSSFSLAAAEGVVAPPLRSAVPEVLHRLVARSLVRTVEAPRGEVRFVLYEAVRAFAAGHQPPEARDSLARWYAAHAEAWVQRAFADGGSEWDGPVSDELANVLDALAAADGRPDLVARLALAADGVLQRTGPLVTNLALLDGALAVPGLAPDDRAALLAARSRMHRYTGAWDRSEVDARAALAVADGRRCRAQIYGVISGLMLESGRPESTVEACDRILELAPDDPQLAAVAYADRGGALFVLGHPEAATRDYAEAERLVAPHDRYRLALILANHGGVQAEIGRYDRALPLLLRCSELLGELHCYDGHHALVQGNLAHVYVEQQESGPARAALDLARTLARRARYRRVEGIAALTASVLCQESGRPDEALGCLQDASALLAGVDPWYEARIHLVWGGLDHERGWLPSAAAHYEATLAIARPRDDRPTIALAAARLSLVQASWGRSSLADELWSLARDHAPGRCVSEGAAARELPLTAGNPPATPVSRPREFAPAVSVHAAHLAALRGDVEAGQAALSWAEGPCPEGPGPTRAAWSSPVRLAVRLLRAHLRATGT